MTRSRSKMLKTWAPRVAACVGAMCVGVASCLMATGSVATLDGCADDDAGITLDDVTGIVIRSEPLFAPVGCGTGPSEVYRYLGVVDDPTNGNAPIANAVAVYPCYADATFDLVNPISDTYRLRVYAFDFASYQALGNSDAPLLATLGEDTGLRALSPTYLTTCSAQQISNIEVLAVCNPLVALGDAGVLDTDAGADAGDAGDTDAASDADSAAAADDAGDGGDGGDATAGDASDAGANDAD